MITTRRASPSPRRVLAHRGRQPPRDFPRRVRHAIPYSTSTSPHHFPSKDRRWTRPSPHAPWRVLTHRVPPCERGPPPAPDPAPARDAPRTHRRSDGYHRRVRPRARRSRLDHRARIDQGHRARDRAGRQAALARGACAWTRREEKRAREDRGRERMDRHESRGIDDGDACAKGPARVGTVWMDARE